MRECERCKCKFKIGNGRRSHSLADGRRPRYFCSNKCKTQAQGQEVYDSILRTGCGALWGGTFVVLLAFGAGLLVLG
jgi:hypothetical protein